jgi:hypothetical protein
MGLDGSGGDLGVQRVGLAAPAPGLAVGTVDLDHDLAVTVQEARQPSPEAAGTFDPPALDLAQALGPAQQLGIAGRSGRDADGVQAPTKAVVGHRDVDLGVGIDPDRDLRGRWLCHGGDGRLLSVVGWTAPTGRAGGHDCDGSVATGSYEVTFARLVGAPRRPQHQSTDPL